MNFLECGEYYKRIGFERCPSRGSLNRTVKRLSTCEGYFRELMDLRLLPALGREFCVDSSALKLERYRYEGDQTWRRLRRKGDRRRRGGTTA